METSVYISLAEKEEQIFRIIERNVKPNRTFWRGQALVWTDKVQLPPARRDWIAQNLSESLGGDLRRLYTEEEL